MTNVKVLKNPGFLYDLNYLFFAKFNTQLCIENLVDGTKKEAYKKHIKEMLQYFGEISDDLYIFYHAKECGRCFITTFYVDPHKDKFGTEFDFKYFLNIVCDREAMRQNMIRFYLQGLSEEELEACFASSEKLFACIKKSNYSGDEKSRLYEFFINPKPYFQALEHELITKEVLLSNYYKENYHKIMEAHNNTTFDILCQPFESQKDLSFLKNSDQVLYTSYCLLNKYFINLWFIKDGAIYLLGYDYFSIIAKMQNDNKTIPLHCLCSALGEVSRVKILELLLERDELTCKEIEKLFAFSGSTAYHHITLLTKVGAVRVRNEGKTIYYSLNKKFFDIMREKLKKFSNRKELLS